MESTVGRLLNWIDSNREKNSKEILDYVCNYLKSNVETYNWVGVYIVNGNMLTLLSYAGEETEHGQIRIGDGLCSLAILRNSTVNEPNVKSNSEYLACFPSTESELVVPVMHAGKSVGEIDIDSDRKSAFGPSDEQLMARVADRIADIVGSLSK